MKFLGNQLISVTGKAQLTFKIPKQGHLGASKYMFDSLKTDTGGFLSSLWKL